MIYKFSHYWDSIQGYKSFTLLFSHTITPKSLNDKAAFVFEAFSFGEAKDSSCFSKDKIFTPEMIMDSLSKYRFDYERRNRGKFYVIIKGQGPIWYLHKAELTYLWTPDEMENEGKKVKSKTIP